MLCDLVTNAVTYRCFFPLPGHKPNHINVYGSNCPGCEEEFLSRLVWLGLLLVLFPSLNVIDVPERSHLLSSEGCISLVYPAMMFI